ncbi:helix-turn-helix domain-containing protein [Sphingobium sp. WCS2017Hpa-17]|uniref:helix-turn-helix domain-containing protein n=1 Tax=Sphingobium sp. WCS2017Hpa-17 TaxID=3073638 RepID=UPI00288B6CA6|nr:helix-turn-helix domain-containing protein [Sphingobium sp. WCS2017Hpa-17]
MTSSLIIERAAEISGYPVSILRGPARDRPICMVRWAIMAILRARGLSLATIGRLLNRHHTSVISGLERVERLRRDPAFTGLLEALA